MIAYRGNHAAVQYLPKKPIPIGFKCFTISTLQGYCFNQKLYPGKHEDKKAAAGFTTAVVKQLLQPYITYKNGDEATKQWRCVTFDSYYTSVPLVKDLYNSGILSVGTIYPNRKHLPDAFAEEKVAPDKFIARPSTCVHSWQCVTCAATNQASNACSYRPPHRCQYQSQNRKLR